MKVLIAFAVLVAVAAAVQPQHIEPEVILRAASLLRPETRITNGEPAAVCQFPHQVGLRLYLDEGKAAWCGGTLIGKRWVLTAAHCADGVLGVDVHLGYTNRSDASERTQQLVYVQQKNIIVHKDWDASNLKNDIALLRLSYPINYNECVQPAYLPKNVTNSFEGELAIASGWGRDSDAAQSVSTVLRWIEVPIMTNAGCGRYFGGSITPSQICIRTSGTRKSTCNGDSGGPLIVQENGKTVVIGATSFGIALGCEKGFPGVFTRVTAYLDWIEQISGITN